MNCGHNRRLETSPVDPANTGLAESSESHSNDTGHCILAISDPQSHILGYSDLGG